MTDPAVEAVARAIWDAEERAHSPSDPMPWEEGSTLSHVPYLRSAQAATAALREQGSGPISPEMKAVCEASAQYSYCYYAIGDPNLTATARLVRKKAEKSASRGLEIAALALGRALLKEDGK